MKFILAAGNWLSEWPLVAKAVPEAENLGFWGVVLPDHYMWMQESGYASLDAWTALAYLAARTRRIRLGTLVTPIPLRPPAVLAKIVATLDVISGGRVVLGVGAGWLQAEFEAYSQWDDPPTRVEKTREGLRLILRLWTEKRVNFKGRFFNSKNAVLEPKPVQRPHPPLLFGGEGHRMLRLAAEYADLCFIPPWLDFLDSKKVVDVEVRRRMRRGLRFAAGAPSLHPPYLGPRYDSNAYLRRVEEARNAGCEYFVVPFPRRSYLDCMKQFSREVAPSFSSRS